MKLDGRQREHIQIGQLVRIVRKQDQRTGSLSDGIIKRILTKSSFHPYGIKVLLTDGQVGRVKAFVSDSEPDD